MIPGRKDARIYKNHQQVKLATFPAYTGPPKPLGSGVGGGRASSVWGEPRCLFAMMSWFTPAILASHPTSTPVHQEGPCMDSELCGYPVPGKLKGPTGRVQPLGLWNVFKKLCL